MIKKTEVFYIVYDGIVSLSVFDSQVMGFLVNLTKNKDININLIGFENMQVFFTQRKKMAEKEAGLHKLGIKTNFFPRIPGSPGLYINSVFLLLFLAGKMCMHTGRNVILHARGTKSAFIGCIIRRFLHSVKVVYDARGIAPEEYACSLKLKRPPENFMKKREIRIFQWLKRIEEYSVKRSDIISCVSNSFKKYYMDSYNIEDIKVKVIPGGVDASVFNFSGKVREKMREEMGLGNRIVFVYSGTMHQWQMVGKICRFFREFHRLNPDAFFLFLTFQTEKAEEFFRKESISSGDYGIYRVKHEKVPLYLNASDVSIIIREKNIVNKVASPVKIIEYLACGLFTVLTEGIGDVSELVRKEGMGIVAKDASDEEMRITAEKILTYIHEIQDLKNKARISSIAHRKYAWENLNPLIMGVYAGVK